jgi:hypothetical protein
MQEFTTIADLSIPKRKSGIGKGCPRLWADGVCIHQSYMEEKRIHVQDMDKIFENADLVYSWLGLGSSETEQAMNWIAETGSRAPGISPEVIWREDLPHDEIRKYVEARPPRQSEDKETHGASEIARFMYDILNDPLARSKDVIAGIHDILRRDYWHRMWIIQEIALAKTVIVMCGGKSDSLDDFDRTLCAIEYFTHRVLFHLHKEYEGSDRIVLGTAYEIKSLQIRLLRCLGQPVHIWDILFQCAASPDRPHYSASDPRDLAFALLGVLNSDSRQMLTIDYNQKVENVFTMLTRAMFHEQAMLGDSSTQFRLDWCIPREEETTMPSWVPDWSQVGKYGFRVWPITYAARFNGTAGMEQPRPTSSGKLEDVLFLHLHGHHVDVVTKVMEPPEWIEHSEWDVANLTNAESWLDSVYEFTGLGTESGPAEDYIWRAILRDYADINGGFRHDVPTEDVIKLIRQLFRREKPKVNELSENESYFISNGMYHPSVMAELGDIEEQV